MFVYAISIIYTHDHIECMNVNELIEEREKLKVLYDNIMKDQEHQHEMLLQLIESMIMALDMKKKDITGKVINVERLTQEELRRVSYGVYEFAYLHLDNIRLKYGIHNLISNDEVANIYSDLIIGGALNRCNIDTVTDEEFNKIVSSLIKDCRCDKCDLCRYEKSK